MSKPMEDAPVVAYIDKSGHPHHVSYRQGIMERKQFGPMQPLVTKAAHEERIARLLARLEQAERDAGRYRLLRRGQHWSIIDGIGDILRAEVLDAAIDAHIAAIASEAKT